MDIQEFQLYIEEKIPLVKKAGFKIRELGIRRVVVGGDFSENKNHHDTVFGGSMSAILTLASWALVQEIMNAEDTRARIVIARQTIDYLKPATGDFTAECSAPGESEISRFIESYRKKGSGRIGITAFLKENGALCARFEGEFHASGPRREGIRKGE